jgi:GNAT superfamily N-acetyltransferase
LTLTPPLVAFALPDAPALLALSESIGWPHELMDWQAALSASRIFGHRDSDGTVLSSSAIYIFSPEFAALALVIVREEQRGRGLARAAVLECLRQAPNAAILLVATEYGEPLYLKLGFHIVQQIVRLIAPRGVACASGAKESRRMTESDLAAVLDLDRIAYGADRSGVLRKRWANAERGAVIHDASGCMQGFAWMTRQRGGLVIAPVIASGKEQAMALLGKLTEGCTEQVKIEVPDTQVRFIETLQAAGFAIDSARALMLKNAEIPPGNRSLIFALASLGYG